jgi:hypothetical protein
MLVTQTLIELFSLLSGSLLIPKKGMVYTSVNLHAKTSINNRFTD